MLIPEPLIPTLDEIFRLIGEAGSRLMTIGASEGAAGNISVFLGWPINVSRQFPQDTQFALPIPVPELAGCLFLVTGSGRRLGEIAHDPEANLCAIRVHPGGTLATIHTSTKCLFEKPTSELNSHLAVHREFIPKGSLNFHAVIHAQPPHLTFLSQLESYQNTQALSTRILRWQPETIVHLPQGRCVSAVHDAGLKRADGSNRGCDARWPPRGFVGETRCNGPF